MQVTKDTIWDVMMTDFSNRMGFKFRDEPGAKATIEALCGSGEGQFYPAKLRAMWNIYMDDPKEMELGPAIKRFTDPRVLNKLGLKVHKGAVGFGNLVAGPDYECETWVKKAGCGFTTSFTAQGNSGSPWPDVWDVPCPRCGGRRLRVGSALHQKAYEDGMATYKQGDDYMPWPDAVNGIKALPKPMHTITPVPVVVPLAVAEPESCFDIFGTCEEVDFF